MNADEFWLWEVGTGDGHLYVFENGATTLTRSVKAHTGPVYTLHPVFSAAPVKAAAASDEQLGDDGSEGQGFWSGGKDGLVKFYNGQALAGGGGMGKKRLPGAGGSGVSLDPAVRSVFSSRDGRRLLVGTRGGELYEMSTADGSDAASAGAGGASGRGSGGGPLTAGHGRGQVWGLSAHPTERLYATCGDDGSVRIWSLDDRRVVGSISTDCSCRAICYSPDGSALAMFDYMGFFSSLSTTTRRITNSAFMKVGCGGGKGKADATKSGTFLVLKSENLSLRHEGKDADDWIRDVNYSSDGARLAVASNDCKVYIYATKDGFTKLSTIASHQSFVTHVDFSSDGNYVQSADGASSLLFADAATGIQIPSAAAMKDIEWGTWTLPFGWAARGVWPIAGNDPGTEISCARRSGDSSLLAAGDNFGCGVDGSVMQWRKIAEPDAIDSGDEAQRSGEDSELEGDGGLRCCNSRKQPQQQTVRRLRSAMHEGPAGAADPRAGGGGEVTGGDAAAAGGGESAAASAAAAMAGVSPSKAKMPWVAAMVPPSNMKADTTAPEIRTRLDAVHGCRAEDLRGCVWYNHEEGIVYPVAALCVIYDPRTGRQSYHDGHLGDVISLTVSSCRRFAASGDAADPPRVHVWDAVTGAGVVCGAAGGETSGLLPSFHKVGVALLAFSCNGHWLASMGHDPEHTLAVYTSPSGQWWDAFPVATAKAGFTRFLCLVFTGQEAFPLLAGGIKTVSFFGHTDGSRGLRRKRGVFGFRKKIQPVLCAVKMGEDQTTLTGTVTGHLYSWKYGVFETHPASAVLHSICSVGSACKFVACTRAGEIYEISKDSGRLLLLADGHGKGQLRGLATHPTDPDVYATVGDDAFVRVWSLSLRRATLKMKVDSAARSLAFSPSGKHLVVGLGGDRDAMVKEGTVIVLSAETLEILEEVRSAKTWISDMKYSKDGALLAVATSSGQIYVHDAADHYSLKCTTKKLEDVSSITSMDFSTDREVLQATTSSKDLLFFHVADGRRLTAKSKTKDLAFETQTCPAGWTVQATWPQGRPDLEPVSTDRCTPALVERQPQLGALLAAGYKTGQVEVFR
ncbi:unnamed protein product [Ectocarpus sp. CCAP 1310/34]|nr:unnamed protein product [Ectocarpus sp. CCAP 1310/34]